MRSKRTRGKPGPESASSGVSALTFVPRGSRARVPPEWRTWCTKNRRKFSVPFRCAAVLRSLRDGVVRGCYSDFPLDPGRDSRHPMYPGFEYLAWTRPKSRPGIDARVVTSMKAHLREKEFWQLIGHLYAVGVDKGRIRPGAGLRLPDDWHPRRRS